MNHVTLPETAAEDLRKVLSLLRCAYPSTYIAGRHVIVTGDYDAIVQQVERALRKLEVA